MSLVRRRRRPLLPRRVASACAWLADHDRATGWAMLALALYYAIAWGAFQGKAAGDGWFGFLYLKALFYFHTVDMQTVAPEYLRFFGVSGPHQAMPNRCPIGPVFVWMPFYLLVAVPEWIGRSLGLLPEMRDYGQTKLHIWVAGLGTLLAVLVGWRAVLRLCSRHFDRQAARVGAALSVLATPLLWYTANNSFYQHGVAFMMVALLVDYWDRTRGQLTLRRFALFGLMGGYAMAVRAQEALWLLLPGAEVAWGLLQGPRRGRWLLGAALFALFMLLALSPQIAVWHFYSGGWGPVQAEPLRLREPFLLLVLFATHAGLFPWTPLAYLVFGALVVAGGRWLRRQAPGAGPTALLVGGMALIFAIEVYVVASAWVVAGGFSFGCRRLTDAMPLFGVAMALLWQWAASLRARRLVAAALVFCVAYNVLLTELLRRRILTGSFPIQMAEFFAKKLRAPERLVRLAEWVGYPFVQPMGWLFGARYRVPPGYFEKVVGPLFLERDGQWFTILSKELELIPDQHASVAAGLAWGPGDHYPRVTGPVRLLLPLFAKEPFDLELYGVFPPGGAAARWNGKPVQVERAWGGLRLSLTAAEVRAGTNEVELTLPEGSRPARLAFNAKTRWW